MKQIMGCLAACLILCGEAYGQEKTAKEHADALKSTDFRVRLMALAGLANAGADAAPHVDAIARVLKDANVQVRRGAAQVLAMLGPDAETAAPALVLALKDGDPVVKQTVFKALTDLGPKSFPALEAGLKDTDPSARLLVAIALEGMAADYPEAVKGLTLALKDSTVKVRLLAISGLTKIGAAAKDNKEVMEGLSEAINNKSAEVRGAAIAALFEMDRPATAVLLMKALGDKDADIRRTAAQALGVIADELDMPAILAIRAALADEDAKVRQYAAAGLAKAGLKARELGEGKKVNDALFKLMSDKDAIVRQTAVYALGQIGIDDKEDIKKLAEGMKDSAFPVRAFTIQALAQYSHEEAPAEWRTYVMGLVADGIKDRDRRVVFTAAKILVAEKQYAVPALIKMVETTVGLPRIAAAQVLAEIGEDARDAVPALQKMSKEGMAESRQAALLALQKIMP